MIKFHYSVNLFRIKKKFFLEKLLIYLTPDLIKILEISLLRLLFWFQIGCFKGWVCISSQQSSCLMLWLWWRGWLLFRQKLVRFSSKYQPNLFPVFHVEWLPAKHKLIYIHSFTLSVCLSVSQSVSVCVCVTQIHTHTFRKHLLNVEKSMDSSSKA